MSFQSLTILGNVGKDPVIRSLNSGDQVANFSIAVSERRKGDDVTVWFNCTAFGKTAGVVESYVRKGSKVLVQGRIQTRAYEKDGVTREAWDVVVDRLSLESTKAEGGAATSGRGVKSDWDDDDESSIPF